MEARISDAEVKCLFVKANPTLQEIKYAKILLAKYPNAQNIEIKAITGNPNAGAGAGGAGVIVIFILAIVLCPLMVILGMRGKFLFKKMYKNRSGALYDNFVVLYTRIGIGLYVVAGVLVLLALIVKSLTWLLAVAIMYLIIVDIVYLVCSLMLTKQYISKEENTIIENQDVNQNIGSTANKDNQTNEQAGQDYESNIQYDSLQSSKIRIKNTDM